MKTTPLPAGYQVKKSKEDRHPVADFFLGPKCSCCGVRRTHKEVKGKPLCDRCQNMMYWREQVKGEGRRKCPVEGARMIKKLIESEVLIDVCPKCGGVWLDKDQLDKIRELAESEGENSGRMSGLAMGMVISSGIHHGQ